MLPSLTFLLAATLLAITPGPGIAYVVACTVSGGRAEGIKSTLGTAVGGMVHVLAAALGLSLLIAQSAFAFAAVKYWERPIWSISASGSWRPRQSLWKHPSSRAREPARHGGMVWSSKCST